MDGRHEQRLCSTPRRQPDAEEALLSNDDEDPRSVFRGRRYNETLEVPKDFCLGHHPSKGQFHLQDFGPPFYAILGLNQPVERTRPWLVPPLRVRGGRRLEEDAGRLQEATLHCQEHGRFALQLSTCLKPMVKDVICWKSM